EFTKDAVDRVFELTQGQPWLVNALAQEIAGEMGVTGTITAGQAEEAKERLIRARAIHLDSLVARLHEPRVERVIEPPRRPVRPGPAAAGVRRVLARARRGAHPPGELPRGRLPDHPHGLPAPARERRRPARPRVRRRHQTPRRAGDRKSTRLNSSHVKNSYAVFCLKNKK